ncbi:MAG: regulatory protein RecX [Saprospiraceae bacterium]
MDIKKWNKDNAKTNIEAYCAYQERCHSEVRSKLLNHGIYGDFLEELISSLIENNFLNEERFALLYAGGKFRIKRWGTIKIKQVLKLKGVSNYSIQQALSSFEDTDYLDAIQYWVDKRGGGKIKRTYPEKMDLVRFIQSKGFEIDKIFEVLGEG